MLEEIDVDESTGDLEELEPDFLTDGLGTSGISGVLPFAPPEDRTRWSSNVVVLNLRDSDDPCCPAACPASITVTFHGVLFDCGCTFNNFGGGSTSAIVTDISLDGAVISMVGGNHHVPCDVAHCDFVSSAAPNRLHTRSYNNATCSGTPDFEGDIPPQVYVALVGGTWSVFGFVDTLVGDAAFFIGSGSNPASISNTMFCTTNTGNVNWDDNAIECQILAPLSASGVAHAGTCTISF